MLSIIIPTLNAAGRLAATLAALRAEAPGAEIVVCDGGSSDESVAIARAGGAVVVETRAGRGRQLARGARASAGDWLLFLHADTILLPGWCAAAEAFMAAPANRQRAGYFRFALDDDDPRARRIERLTAWRCRRIGLPYGDQGLLIARGFYFSRGGYRPMPLMEDVSQVRRIGRRRLLALDAVACTSAARYRRDGYTARPVRNVTLLILYFLGVPTHLLKRLYG